MEGASSEVFGGGGGADGDVHGHRGCLVEVLGLGVVRAEDDGERGDHDDAAADAEEAPERAGGEADSCHGRDGPRVERHGVDRSGVGGARCMVVA